MILDTLRSGWTKLSDTNLTGSFSSTFAKSTTTKPTGARYIDLNSDGAKTCNALLFKFWMTNAQDLTLKVRLWGVSEWVNPTANDPKIVSYEFALLAELLVTSGNIQGTANCMIGASDFEADTIALTYGNDDVGVSIVSPGNDVRGACVLVDTLGFGLIAVEGDLNSSSVSWNAGYKRQ